MEPHGPAVPKLCPHPARKRCSLLRVFGLGGDLSNWEPATYGNREQALGTNLGDSSGHVARSDNREHESAILSRILNQQLTGIYKREATKLRNFAAAPSA
jgi:hypothetical protein